MPPPGLAEAEEGVRAAFEERHAALEALLRAQNASTRRLAEAYGALGMWLHAYRYPEAAATCYSSAERLSPQDVRWPYYLGRIHAAAGDSDAARAAFTRVLTHKPGDVATLVHLAEAELQVGREEQARPLLERAISEDPASVRAQVRLGQLALSRRDYPEATRLLEGALSRAPESSEVHQGLGMAYRGLGEPEKAKVHLARAQATRENPQLPLNDPLMLAVSRLQQDAHSYDSLGRREFQEGRYAAAAGKFREAIAAAPDRTVPRHNLAMALLKMGRVEEAKKVLFELLEVAPEFPEAHFLLGTILNQPATRNEAQKHFRAAVEANPRMPAARYELARLLHSAGRVDEALAHYAQAVELSPTDPSARGWLALALLGEGRLGKARDTLADGLAAGSESPQLKLLLARLLATAPDATVRDGQRALELARDLFKTQGNVGAAETVAMAHAELGEFERAAAWQRAALEAAVGAGTGREAAWLTERLVQYERSIPCRAIWARGETGAVTGSIQVRPPQ